MLLGTYAWLAKAALWNHTLVEKAFAALIIHP